MGIKPENKTIQLRDLDQRTRTQIINLITDKMIAVCVNGMPDNDTQVFIRQTLSNVYQHEVSSSSLYRFGELLEIIKNTIRSDDYDSVLTLIEYLCNFLEKHIFAKDIFKQFNKLFEQEYVGYRFVNGFITPITDKEEISEINEAIEQAQDETKKHFRKALELLSDRNSPDYENSIKESISAVEAECDVIVGESATLGKALKLIEQKNGIVIHPTLKEAFSKLYGYTNDGKGIRHAGNMGSQDATFAEAKFMLSACSAFVNYLKTSRSE